MIFIINGMAISQQQMETDLYLTSYLEDMFKVFEHVCLFALQPFLKVLSHLGKKKQHQLQAA